MYKVLIVDDEPMILEGLSKLLLWEEYGIEVTAKAESGERAWQMMQDTHPDILITDIRMQGISGLELLRMVRKAGMSIKVIILSGYDDFQYIKEASHYGIENYLLKPIEETELSETLLNLTERLENEQIYRSCVQESCELLRSNILYRWVSGTIKGEELALRTEFLNLSISHDYYQVAIIHSYTHTELDVIAELEQLAFDWGWGNSWTFVTVSGCVVFLFCWNFGDDKDICPLIRQRIPTLVATMHTDILVTLGSPQSGWQGAQISYNEAANLLKYSAGFTHNTLIFSEEITVCTILPQVVETIENQSINPVVDTVIRYVESNYDQPISLKTLAVKYKVNAAYLGQLFKQSTGQLFSNYLCALRIKAAKTLLTGTQMRTTDIAVKVGFSNINYFSNLFKKTTGLYPTEYRSYVEYNELK